MTILVDSIKLKTKENKKDFDYELSEIQIVILITEWYNWNNWVTSRRNFSIFVELEKKTSVVADL